MINIAVSSRSLAQPARSTRTSPQPLSARPSRRRWPSTPVRPPRSVSRRGRVGQPTSRSAPPGAAVAPPRRPRSACRARTTRTSPSPRPGADDDAGAALRLPPPVGGTKPVARRLVAAVTDEHLVEPALPRPPSRPLRRRAHRATATARSIGSGPAASAASRASTGCWASSPRRVATASSGAARQRPVRGSTPKSRRAAARAGSATRWVMPSGAASSACSTVRAWADQREIAIVDGHLRQNGRAGPGTRTRASV